MPHRRGRVNEVSRAGRRRTLERVEISVDMCLAGRELTEPELSPDGAIVAFVARWGTGTAIVTVPCRRLVRSGC